MHHLRFAVAMAEDEQKVEAEEDAAEKEEEKGEEGEIGKAADGTQKMPALVSCDKQWG